MGTTEIGDIAVKGREKHFRAEMMENRKTFSTELVKSLSPEIFKTCWDLALSTLLWLVLL